MLGSRLSNAPSAPRYISGKATTTAAITVAGQLKMSGKPMSMNHWPTGVLLPNANSSKKPQTVGGSTIGMVKMVSKRLRNFGVRCRQKYAAAKPKMKMNTMAVNVVRSVTHNGDQSSVDTSFPTSSNQVGCAAMTTSEEGTSEA